MYNFNFMDDEELIDVFEEVLIKQNSDEKITTIALTDKRILFLDYTTNDGFEVLRITKGINFNRYKEVYYEIKLCDIKNIYDEEYYGILLKNNTIIEFNNSKLYKLLKQLI